MFIYNIINKKKSNSYETYTKTIHMKTITRLKLCLQNKVFQTFKFLGCINKKYPYKSF